MPMLANKVNRGLLLAALFLFCIGFLSGYILNGALEDIEDTPRQSSLAANSGPAEITGESGEPARAEKTARKRKAPSRKKGAQRSEEEDPGTPEEKPADRSQILAGLQAAIADDDKDALEEMLEELADSDGEPLTDEELQILESLLTAENSDHLKAITQALIRAGDERGVEIVMGFLDNTDNSLSNRREILDSLERLPPDSAALVASDLADFIASGPHRELESKAARVFGRLHGEEGVGSLIALLDNRPDIRPEVLFEAMGSIGGGEELDSMIGLMDGDWSREQKRTLMESIGRASLEEGNTDTLMDLLKEQPPGMSQRLVADGIERLSHQLDADFLADALREIPPNDPRAQEAIARALAHTGGTEGLERLLEAAADPDFDLSNRALARALEGSSSPEATTAMIDLLKTSTRQDIVEPLARGLSRNGNSETVGALLDLLESSPNPEQRRAIARALEETNRNALPQDRLLDLISRENDSEIARNLGRSLERLYPNFVEEHGESLFQNAEAGPERVAYARMLSRHGGERAVGTIADQLAREPDRQAAAEMAHMLGRSDEGIRRAGSIISQTPVHQGENRHSIMWGLHSGSSSENPAARNLFLQIAGSDPSPHMRSQAAEILAHRNDIGVLPQLEELVSRERDEGARARMQLSIQRLHREAARQN